MRSANCEMRSANAGRKSCVTLLCFILLHSAYCLSALAQDYSNHWFTVDGGGQSSTGGVYTVTGTAGQPDASRVKMTGGEYTVNGGFWGRIAVVQMPGAPPLTLRRTGVNTLAICWPYPSTGYGLQLSTNLNTVNWAAATNVPVQVGDEWQITVNPPTEGSLDEAYCQYYRLKKP